ncbi:unnamed protein product [Vitrella brassicaformis CCMP3155]|uniref:Uncharacterized protein n=1 Tax=Vitrella brassicaformis (strain CCMP3155) TaxID=1169540 RepID=A0A0G4GIN7_VITBC|nr:unnamed protein product [Vitrella brassicaformis CCMP3155]|eukprot:CEM29701.1 unnamed protein product [Vitrella brassicaformis CCMP3155]
MSGRQRVDPQDYIHTLASVANRITTTALDQHHLSDVDYDARHGALRGLFANAHAAEALMTPQQREQMRDVMVNFQVLMEELQPAAI